MKNVNISYRKRLNGNLEHHLHAVKYSSQITSFSNGRYVRNIVEKSIRTQAMRLLQEDAYDKYDLVGISSSDLMLEGDAQYVSCASVFLYKCFYYFFFSLIRFMEAFHFSTFRVRNEGRVQIGLLSFLSPFINVVCHLYSPRFED